MTIWKCAFLAMTMTLSLMSAPARSQVQRMVDQLTVTADQKVRLDPLLEADAKQLRALRDDTSLSVEDRKKKTAEIRKATDVQLKTILTADQWTKLEQLREERKKQRKQ